MNDAAPRVSPADPPRSRVPVISGVADLGEDVMQPAACGPASRTCAAVRSASPAASASRIAGPAPAAEIRFSLPDTKRVFLAACRKYTCQVPSRLGGWRLSQPPFSQVRWRLCGQTPLIPNRIIGGSRLRLLRNHGMRDRYDYSLPGYNYRLTDLQAAIATAQLRRLPGFNARRARNASRLSDAALLACLAWCSRRSLPGAFRFGASTRCG